MADSTDGADHHTDENSQVADNHTPQGDLFYLIHELSRLTSAYFDQAMAAHRVTRAQWWGMMHVAENEGATQTELASRLQMGRAATGKLLERLEAKGWVTRRDDASDSRVRRVYLSGDAPKALGVMGLEGARLYSDFLAGISIEEIEEMLIGLRKIKANAERQVGVSRGE